MRIDEYPTQFGEQYDLGANNVQVFMQLKSQENNQVTYFNYNDVTKYLQIQYVLKTIENGIVKQIYVISEPKKCQKQYFENDFYGKVISGKNFICLDLQGLNIKHTGYDSAKLLELQILKSEEEDIAWNQFFSTLQVDTWVQS